ncbi:hypothetical protein R3P38DRAFT_2829294 [Favolaschia claudopus]|uniref:Uncharacterized protein n=1 Tax=Favolaschia claudopus TaxID=2862362 RepID=A0AAW0EB21_9AGAR
MSTAFMSNDIPPYERRPFPFNRLDEEAVAAANEAQLAARDIALRTPLQSGLQFTLTREIPAQNAAPNARKLPGIPGSDSVTVRLCEELQQGIDGFSQVWTAVCVEKSETQLVLKILQPSICRGIPWDHRDEHFDPWDLAHNEAWVYHHLLHIQGTLIPYFFGLSTVWFSFDDTSFSSSPAYQIVTPCGEEAVSDIREFVCVRPMRIACLNCADLVRPRGFCGKRIHSGRLELARNKVPQFHSHWPPWFADSGHHRPCSIGAFGLLRFDGVYYVGEGESPHFLTI